MTSRTLRLLESAIDQTGKIIIAMRPEQASLPTPCPDWDVQALVRHLIGQDLRNFTAAARGHEVDYQAPPDALPADWSSAFREGAAELIGAWRTADLDELGGTADMQVAEFAVHDWDLVRATGEPIELDDEIADHALAWSKTMLRPEYRGPNMAFGHEVPVPDDAPIQDRMVAWFGRDPSWAGGR
jgi:uncharacterized protein (TIGR03086 family)